MQVFTGQGGAGFTADGVQGQLFLQFVIRIVRHVADPAAVNDGRFFFFRQKPMKLRVIAGGNNERVNGPLEAVNFNAAVLDDAQVDLDQVFFILIDFIAEMNTAAGNPGQCAAPQIEAIRIVESLTVCSTRRLVVDHGKIT